MLIRLFGDKYAIIDEEDYKLISQYKWHVNHYGYAVCNKYVGNYKSTAIFMHRLIMQTPKGMDTDHINHNPLDNRKSNLRVCTHANNQKNLSLRKNNTSGVRGVRWHKQLQKWNARIYVNGKEISLGCYRDLKEATKARKDASLRYYGEFA